MSGFRQAAVVQARVIGALMLRDLVIQSSVSAIPYANIVVRHSAVTAMLYVMGKANSAYTPQGFPLLVFINTGYLAWNAFIRCFSGVNYRGSVPLLLFPHVTPLDFALSRAAVDFVIYSVLFIVFCIAGVLFDQASPPDNPLGVMLAFWFAILLGFGLGIIASTITRFTTLFDDAFIAFRLTGFAVSGVFVLASDTPQFVLQWLQYNPLFQSIEWMRQCWWPAYQSPIANPAYIVEFLFFLFAVGLAFERATRRRHGDDV